jgi:hypothetical protein
MLYNFNIRRIIREKKVFGGRMIMCTLNDADNMIFILVFDTQGTLIDSVANLYTESTKNLVRRYTNAEFKRRKDIMMKKEECISYSSPMYI